ncbi:MAG TPA: efflux RND transporter permease subunit [Gammaproteobacteria bacterium]|jgi:HAE1 family hydrophobic/amphiphilic exporter-1|nr:efflux RND transporter permease subunit [Gammaproteobacteria bacterium]
MNLSAPFIHRPVMTTVVMAGLLVFGLFAYDALPVSELPSVDFPTINVSANLPGANPESMASSVATPLERQFSAISGVTAMSSSNTTGNTNITLQFDLSRNIDAAAQDVQTAISQSIRQLPLNMPTPPTLRKVNPADYGIIYLAITADSVPLTQLDEYAETRVAAQLSQVPGVAQVIVFGSYQYATRIYVNPYALSARGLSLDMLSDAIKSNNTNLPSGTLYGSTHTYTVQSNGQLTDADAYNRMIVAYQDGAPVHLSDVARAVDGVQQDKQLTTFSDADDERGKLRPAIVLAVKRQPGANTVTVSQAVQSLLPEITRQAPGDARVHLLYDRAGFIKGSIGDVRTTLLLAIALVVGVIFLFLRNLRATLISALALPTSVVGTFAVMQLAGFSLDNLSLMALTLAVGFVVDDAIVVLENIVRFREHGEPSMRAALLGSQEIGFTVVSMTLSLVAVFIPILFMGGIVGRLFSEFAMTVGIAILISGFVSLTLTPMLASRFIRDSERHGRLYNALESGFDHLREWYRVSLTWAVDHWPAMLGVGGVVLLLTFVLFALVPKGFIPSEDTGQVLANTQAAEGVTFEQLNAMQQQVAKIAQQNPGVQALMSSAGQGFGGTASSNIGRMFIGLKPMRDREKADDILQQLRKAVAPVRDMQVFFQNPPAINVGSIGSNAQFQYVLQGPDIDALYAAAPKFEQQLDTLPGIRDVSSDLQLDNPQIDVKINREAASSLGVTAEQVQSILYSAYGGQQVSTIYGPTNEYWVMMQLAPQYQSDIGALDALYVRGAADRLVPLRAVADISPGVGPLQVNHYAQLPAVTLSFDLDPGLALGDVTSRIETLADSNLPSDISGSFAGNARTFQQSMVDLPILLLVTILVIYMVLAILYEHFIHPLTILTALPLAMVGALLSLLLFGQELNIFSFVGLIMLVGLVKKNGIIMVDFALQIRREKGLSARDAIIEACLVRFRPIMMTTMAAILGTLPIALGFGMGAEARRPLGIATVGGLIFSQMLTLFLTPAFYVAMEHLSARFKREPETAATPEPTGGE